MTFPSNPNNNDIHTAFGRRLKYKSATGAWEVVSSNITPTVVEAVPKTEAVAEAASLPMAGNAVGSMSYSQDTNTLYVWNGTGWFKIALVNTNPTITDGGQATYELNSDGTPTVITLVANDPEGLPLTWSYSVTSGTLEDTTVTNTGAEFTITPGSTAATFDLTFTASDGVNIDTSVSAFTLAFAPDWTAATLLHTLDNPNSYGTATDDKFGFAVAISGDYAIVGASGEDNGSNHTGIAYIFNVTTGSLLHTLSQPSPSIGDSFGYSVAISGNYAIVGAPYYSAPNYTGIAYIFNVTTGVLVHTLYNPNPYAYSLADQFGHSVAISGEHVIVGAPYEGDESPADRSGKAYIFNVTTGALVHTLDNPNAYGTGTEDYFGQSVAIDGNYAIVGAYYEDDGGTGLGEQGGTGANSGKAYIFNVTTGALVHTLDNPNAHYTSAFDYFGYSVAISGNYAAVGVPSEDNNGGNDSGVVYVFNVTTGALVHTLLNQNLVGTASGDNFGTSISMDNYVIFVGAPNEDIGGSGAGGIYMYDVTTGALILPLAFYNNGAQAQDQLGQSVSVSGSYAIAGASYQYSNGGNGGACKIFQAG